jgi:ribosomal protein L12E/L44/L45/RPP1/RPP2
MAHGLGLPAHDYSENLVPGVVEPVLQRDGGMLYPYRMTWPAFWGTLHEGKLEPLDPDDVYTALRNTLRVRRGQTLKEVLLDVKLSKDEKKELLGEQRAGVAEAELTAEEMTKLAERVNKKALEEFQTKLAKALGDLKSIVKQPGAQPVYVAGGKAYRLAADGKPEEKPKEKPEEKPKPEEFEHQAAQPYAWKLAHDVRPARQSIGATGCFDCHQVGSPIFEGQVTAVSPVPEVQPRKYAMYELAGFDKFRLDAWNQSFQGRTAFKWLGFASLGVVSLVLLWYAMRGLTGLAGMVRRKA